jgi:branched-chain amino acid transport system permease protein
LKYKKISKILFCTIICAFLLAVPYVLAENRYWLHIAIMIGVNAVLALSLRLLMTTGLLNLALPAFMAFGAYTSALMTTRFNLPFLFVLLCAGLVAAIFALVLGYPFLRVKGVYFFLITLCFLELFRVTISQYWINIFGGADGIYGIPRPTIGPFHFSDRAFYYYLCLLLLSVTFLVCLRIERSWLGQLLYSLRESDTLGQSVGINATKWRIYAFVIQCFFAGLTGAFQASYLTGINPSMFGFDLAIYIQVYLIVGGVNSLWGPLIGSLLFGGLGDLFRGLGPYQMLIYGLTLVLVMKFLPYGVVSLPSRIHSVLLRYKVFPKEKYETS